MAILPPQGSAEPPIKIRWLEASPDPNDAPSPDGPSGDLDPEVAAVSDSDDANRRRPAAGMEAQQTTPEIVARRVGPTYRGRSMPPWLARISDGSVPTFGSDQIVGLVAFTLVAVLAVFLLIGRGPVLPDLDWTEGGLPGGLAEPPSGPVGDGNRELEINNRASENLGRFRIADPEESETEPAVGSGVGSVRRPRTVTRARPPRTTRATTAGTAVELGTDGEIGDPDTLNPGRTGTGVTTTVGSATTTTTNRDADPDPFTLPDDGFRISTSSTRPTSLLAPTVSSQAENTTSTTNLGTTSPTTTTAYATVPHSSTTTTARTTTTSGSTTYTQQPTTTSSTTTTTMRRTTTSSATTTTAATTTVSTTTTTVSTTTTTTATTSSATSTPVPDPIDPDLIGEIISGPGRPYGWPLRDRR